MTGETAGTSSQANQSVPGWTWPDYIGWGWMIVQARMEADWTGLWDYAILNPKVSEETVARAETRLGSRLPGSYRGFLLATDGWPRFSQGMTTFSISDLLGGELHEVGQIQLELEECVETVVAGGVIAANHFTVVASRESIEIALMRKPGIPVEGIVSWVRGEVIQRYDDLLDYYLSMMELNKLDIVDLGRDYGPKPDGVPHIVIDRSGSPPAFEHARRNDL